MESPDLKDETRPAPAWFVGDLSDPLVAAIADVLPAGMTRVSCAGDLPAFSFDPMRAPGVVVFHRSTLARRDADRIARLRATLKPAPRIVLCFGPHVRHVDLERWGPLIDLAVPEATARDTIARHVYDLTNSGRTLGERRPHSGARPNVIVVSSNTALQLMLVEACETAGYSTLAGRELEESLPPGIVVWDVPLLNSEWTHALVRRTRWGPLVALLGFADRRNVAEATLRGASACLDLPVDIADLVAVLDRIAATKRAQAGHEVPPPPLVRRQVSASRPVVDAAWEG